MKRIVGWLRGFLVVGGVGVILFSVSLAHGNKGNLLESIGQGEVDWTTVAITVHEIEPEAARRSLWQVITGIKLDSQRLVGELISRNVELKERLRGLIQQAKPIKGGPAGVKLQLAGAFIEAVLALQQVGDSSRLPVRFGPPANNPAPAGRVFELGPTGLVIDARGLGAKPALAPQILNEDEEIIYGLTKVSRSYAVQQGLVAYMSDLAIAQASWRVADNPMVIRALRVAPDTTTDLIISNQDAERIRRASQRHDLLHKCRVIIVIE